MADNCCLVWKLDWSVPTSTSDLQWKDRQMSSYLQLPCDWHIIHSENCWENEDSTVDNINNIIVPYTSSRFKAAFIWATIIPPWQSMTASEDKLLSQYRHYLRKTIIMSSLFQQTTRVVSNHLTWAWTRLWRTFYAGSFKYGTQRWSSASQLDEIDTPDSMQLQQVSLTGAESD